MGSKGRKHRREAILLADRIRLKRIHKMDDTKGILASKGVWGGIIALLPMLDTLLVSTGVIPAPLLVDVGTELVTGVGILIAMWGRLSASKTIKGWF